MNTYTPEQVKENRQKWLAALRSGDFTQSRGDLETLDSHGNTVGYCCLGVACVVAMNEGVPLTRSTDPEAGYSSYADPDGALYSGSLPIAVQGWLGVHSSGPRVVTSLGYVSLAALNDGERWTFDQIAEAIEAQPEDWTG